GNSVPVTYVAATPKTPAAARPQPSPMDRGPMPVRTPAAPALAPGARSTPQLMAILKDSLYPSQRENAADTLAGRDWRAQPQIVDALVKAAKEDPAPVVRAECFRSLGRMGANTPAVVAACEARQNDEDPRVRKEAEQTLLTLTGSANHDSGIRPGPPTMT